jgi:type IV pilus assembly protein PilB
MRPQRLDHSIFDNAKPRLGALLVEKGYLTNEQLSEALVERAQSGELLGETLVRLGFIFEDELARVLAEQVGVAFADPDTTSVDAHAAATLPRELGEALCVLPVRFLADGGILVAVADPLDSTLVPQLKLALSCPVEIAVATASSIRGAWRRLAPS